VGSGGVTETGAVSEFRDAVGLVAAGGDWYAGSDAGGVFDGVGHASQTTAIAPTTIVARTTRFGRIEIARRGGIDV
jgi:hypothetical protein